MWLRYVENGPLVLGSLNAVLYSPSSGAGSNLRIHQSLYMRGGR